SHHLDLHSFPTRRSSDLQTEEQVVMLKTSSCKITFKDAPNRKQLSFTSINPVDWVKSIYHLATCHKIFVDNYYGFLAVTVFKPRSEEHTSELQSRFDLVC